MVHKFLTLAAALAMGAAVGITTGNPGYAIAASNAVLTTVISPPSESPKGPDPKK